MLELGILIVAGLVNLLLGIIVYTKNSESTTNKLFLILTSSFVLWSTVNYLSVHPVLFDQIYWVRLVLFFAVFLCLSVYLTFNVFPAQKFTSPKSHRIYPILSALLVMSLTLSPLVFHHLSFTTGRAQPVPGPAIPLFAIEVIALLVGGCISLIKKYRRSEGLVRMQLKFVIFGLAGCFTLIVLTNFILVVVLNNTELIPLGPAYTLIFSGAMAYSIIKHRLFDIRSVVARLLAYLLSLLFIGILYSSLVFGILDLISPDTSSSILQKAYYVAFALLTALTLPSIKTFFDKITSRLFFKDSYDPQLMLDKLNRVLVENVEVERILTDSAAILRDSLKASYCVFVLNKTAYFQIRLFGKNKSLSGIQHAEDINELTSLLKQRITITDYLSDEDAEIKSLLISKNAAVIIKIGSGAGTSKSTIGYLVLGPKRSGYAYTSADSRILKIVSDEQVIAIQNALRFEEIQHFNVTLQEKITAATKELRKTNEKLKALDEAKDEFISMASHQLRTPLTSVKGYVSMVLEGDAGGLKPMQRELLDQAFTSSQRMVYLIADLLNVSRLKTGKFIIETTPTYLPDVIEGELNQLTETAKGRNLVLSYDKPKRFPTLLLDETKTRQVIMNFVDNAIYYTPAGGHIQVNLKESGDAVEFTVVDDGLGVPKEDQHHLFSKFYRAGNAKKARPDGTGLGLFMARKVIAAQGGAIIFKSTEGKGSTFGFTFAKKKILAPHHK